MIVSPVSGQHLVVTQADHARLGSELLRLMPDPAIAAHRRREALLRATAEHDNGWWESDSAPRRSRDEIGPLDFRQVGDADRREVWRRGIERHATAEPYLGALIAGHALRLLGDRAAAGADWKSFLDATAERRLELAATAGVTPAELLSDDRWLALADELSLAACSGESRFVSIPGWRVEASLALDASRLALEPFPFAGATTVALSCRILAPRPFESDAELARELALVRWRRLPVRLVPIP